MTRAVERHRHPRRNDSAWLIPNDGHRTNHRLRADMRRYADDDEVDLVIVGAGAGGSVLPSGWPGPAGGSSCLDAGPFWDPDTDWVSDERGSHGLYWTEPAPDRRRRSGSARIEQLRPRRRRLDGPLRRLHPPLSPVGLPHLHRRRGRRGLADRLRRPAAVLRADRSRAAGRRARTGRGATRTRYPHHAHPVGGNGEIFLRGRAGSRHRGPGRAGRDPQRPVRQPAALHLPRLLPAGLQGQRQSQPTDHPHSRRPRPRRRDPARQQVTRVVVDERTGSSPGVELLSARRRALPASPRGRGLRLLASKRLGCCCCRPRSAFPTGSATTTTRSAAT